MEFANDLMTALRDRAGSGAASSKSADLGPLLDWSGLHARLTSAHAVRQELLRGDSRGTLLCGGFSDWPLSGCDGMKSSLGVNLKDSTDGKGPRGMEIDTAAQFHACGREQ
jgi:hypothetical protein